MRKQDIKVGGHYTAKVSNRVVTVRVDAIEESEGRPAHNIPASPSGTGLGAYRQKAVKSVTYYNVTNLSTGRKTTFRSAAKFRSLARFVETEDKQSSDPTIPVSWLEALED